MTRDNSLSQDVQEHGGGGAAPFGGVAALEQVGDVFGGRNLSVRPLGKHVQHLLADIRGLGGRHVAQAVGIEVHLRGLGDDVAVLATSAE